MGYRQFFYINHDGTKEEEAAMVDHLSGKHNGPWKAEFLTGEAEEAMTWYEFDGEMVELSRMFPHVTFNIAIECYEAHRGEDICFDLKNGEKITHSSKDDVIMLALSTAREWVLDVLSNQCITDDADEGKYALIRRIDDAIHAIDPSKNPEMDWSEYE